jgi:predicted Zn-dependent protease
MPVLLIGCAASPGTGWIKTHGGLDTDAVEQARAEELMGKLTERTTHSRVRIQVLSSDEFVAFSWPGGQIFVTAGLLKQMSDAEVSAAIAHELGHLLGDGQVRSAGSLRGCVHSATAEDREERSDDIGRQILRVSGIPESAMVTMLRKVADAELPTSRCRTSIERRIRRLKYTSKQ